MLLRVLILTLLAGVSQAAPPSPQDAGRTPMFYRYYDEKQTPHMSQMVSEGHLKHGYEELDARMQVIRKVPPRPTEADIGRMKEERQRQAEAAQRQREDQQLMRLYSAPRDAELARDRQIDSIQLRIDFSNNAMSRLRSMRAQEAQRAANFERNGKPVPPHLLEEIASIDKQIAQVQADIQARRDEQDAVRREFEPTIKRLQELGAERSRR